MSHARKIDERPADIDVRRARIIGRGLRAKPGVRLPLRTLREAQHKTQVALSEATGLDQGDISRLENRESFDGCEVTTLRRYVEALGGKLDLVAVFGDKRIILVECKPAARG